MTESIVPLVFQDKDDSIWVRNLDGKYRCLSAEIEAMEFSDILAEFGPITPVERAKLIEEEYNDRRSNSK